MSSIFILLMPTKKTYKVRYERLLGFSWLYAQTLKILYIKCLLRMKVWFHKD